MRLALAALAAAALSVPAFAAPEPLVLDTDSAYFADDGVALVMFLRRPDLAAVRSVTVVAGNYAPLQGAEYMTHVLEMMGRSDIPLYLGADAPLRNDRARAEEMTQKWGLGFKGALGRPVPVAGKLEPPFGGKFSVVRPRTESAVDHLVETLSNSTGTTVVALGPMTNLALALTRKPELAGRIRRLVFMGGSLRAPGNVTPYAEFNFWFDPEAAKLVLESPIRDKVMVGLDLTNQALITRSHFDQLVATRTAVTELLNESLGVRGPKFLTDPKATRFIWDALVPAVMIDPGMVTKSEKAFLTVETGFGPRYGAVATRAGRPGETPTTVLTGLDFPRFFGLFKDLMTAP